MLASNDVLSVRPAHKAEHLRAHSRRRHTRPDCHELARGVPPEHRGQCKRKSVLRPPAAHEAVDRVDARPCDADLHLAGPGLGFGYVADLQLIDVTIARENGSAHGLTPL